MATMNISLPDELRDFVDAQVGEHGYGSSSEYLRELIRKQRDIERLRAALLEGLGSGPAAPLAPDHFERMRDRAKARTSR